MWQPDAELIVTVNDRSTTFTGWGAAMLIAAGVLFAITGWIAIISAFFEALS
jgi:hypothetical protein